MCNAPSITATAQNLNRHKTWTCYAAAYELTLFSDSNLDYRQEYTNDPNDAGRRENRWPSLACGARSSHARCACVCGGATSSVQPASRRIACRAHRAAGTAAHCIAGGVAHRFASFENEPAALVANLAAAGFAATARTWCAEGELLAAVPRLAKHAGRPIVLDVTATRAP